MEPLIGRTATFLNNRGYSYLLRGDLKKAGELSIPITRRPVRSAIGTATRPLPTASSTTGSVASAARDT